MCAKTIEQLQERIEKLERFKAYVHQRLDDAGVETHPMGPHSAEGCRIGDRLDIVLNGRSQAVLDIASERQRQIVGEGWTEEHDDQHDENELERAAAAYALHAGKFHNNGFQF